MAKYIRDIISIPKELIITYDYGIDWDGLRALVEESEMPYKSEVLYIIDNVPEETWEQGRYLTLIDSRNKQLMDLRLGKSYRYMMKYLFPLLRNSSIVMVYFDKKEPIIKRLPIVASGIAINSLGLATPKSLEQSKPLPSIEKRPLFAIKTNLLFDIALTPNIEIEVPIGKRWSINGEFIRGWWLKDDNSFCWQLESFGLEGRYWFGDREDRRVLSGLFVGGFASGGFYDFQFKKDSGIQGEFIMAGISGGYGLAINKNLSFEFSGGVGYIINNYRKYKVIAFSNGDEHYELIKDGHERRFRSFIPAKAKISLVWMFNYKEKKR